jgi:hypothetical protein
VSCCAAINRQHRVYESLAGVLTVTLQLHGAWCVCVQVTHVGEMVDKRRLSEALIKQQRRFHSRAIPPTLRCAAALTLFTYLGCSSDCQHAAVYAQHSFALLVVTVSASVDV